jgi:hypothetical protein
LERIVQHLGRSIAAIRLEARKIGLNRPKPNRVQAIRDFFHKIDSDEKSYWLGFLAADGTIINSKSTYFVQLALQERDLFWLERYRDLLAPGASIVKDRTCFKITIASKEMIRDLDRWGIGQNKTKTLVFPTIPDDFAIPFILGYFDSDGSLRKYRYSWYWRLVGTRNLLQEVRNHIQRHIDIDINEPARAQTNRCPHLYTICAYGNRAMAIDNLLNKSGLGMPRKHL